MFPFFLVKHKCGLLSVVRATSWELIVRAFPDLTLASVGEITQAEADRMVCNGINGFVVYRGKLFPRPA